MIWNSTSSEQPLWLLPTRNFPPYTLPLLFCCEICRWTAISPTPADKYLCYQIGCQTKQAGFGGSCWMILEQKTATRQASLPPLYFWCSMSQKHTNHSTAELSTATGDSNSSSALCYFGLKPLFYSNEFVLWGSRSRWFRCQANTRKPHCLEIKAERFRGYMTGEG